MTTCPYCHLTKNVLPKHIHNCARRPKPHELVTMRMVEKLTYQEIATDLDVSKEIVTTWCKEAGLGHVKVRRMRRAASPNYIQERKRRLYKFLLDNHVRSFSVKYLSFIVKSTALLATAALASLESEGMVSRVDETKWRLASIGLRELAGWPPLESWEGELWRNGSAPR